MKIGVIGYGGVGKAFVELIKQKTQYLQKENIRIALNYILDYNGGVYNKDGIALDEIIAFAQTEKDITKFPKGGSAAVNFDSIIQNRDVDLVVIMTPTNKDTGEPALSYIRSALAHGIHVVTSDKGPVLIDYQGLKQSALENGAQFAIGCTTGGALPSVNAGIIDLAGSSILSIEGVLNGTTNFILEEMKEKEIPYEAALKTAQELGIAETDPTLDVEGWDTATKLLILTNVLMNVKKTLQDTDIQVQGITKITPADIKQAQKEGKKYKLIGRTQKTDGGLTLTVKPEQLDASHPLYNVDGKNKAVKYTSDTLGDLTVIGGASGVVPAAASVLRDIINISRGYNFLN